MSSLQDLFLTIQKEKTHASPSLLDYFTFFYRDIRRYILHFLQKQNLSCAHILIGQDLLPSFWSSALQNAPHGIRNHLQIQFHEQAFKGDDGSLMQQIYKQNTRSI